MRNIFTLVLSFIFITSSFAQVSAVKNGKWDDNATWNTKKQPQSGDNVTIPHGIAVTVDDNEDLSTSNLDINIYGSLVINKGQLRVGENSVITVHSTGRIMPVAGIGGEKIVIGGSEKYNGTQGTIYGTVYASKSTTGFQAFKFTVLPVQFSGFSVAVQNNNVLVQWSTAEEVNAAYFEVQRSINGTDWNSIGQVAAAGNSSQLTKYTFTDRNITSGTIYYRIKQADVTGKTAYTAVQTIRTEAAAQVAIVAYQSNVSVQFTKQVKGKVDVLVVNRAGQVVARQTLDNPVGNVMLNTASLKGAHFVTIQSVAGVTASKQVVL